MHSRRSWLNQNLYSTWGTICLWLVIGLWLPVSFLGAETLVRTAGTLSQDGAEVTLSSGRIVQDSNYQNFEIYWPSVPLSDPAFGGELIIQARGDYDNRENIREYLEIFLEDSAEGYLGKFFSFDAEMPGEPISDQDDDYNDGDVEWIHRVTLDAVLLANLTADGVIDDILVDLSDQVHRHSGEPEAFIELTITYLELGAGESPPVANFSADQTEGFLPLTVTYTDQSSSNATSWFWDFGDGTFSNEQNPQHLYANPGQYAVSLIAENEFGQHQEVKVEYIHVLDPSALATLEPVADVFVRSSRTDRNYGDEDHLRARGDDNDYRTYIKFALPEGFAWPERALLRLYVTDGSDQGGMLYLVSNEYMGGGAEWTEYELTWENAPPPEEELYLGTIGSVDDDTWAEFDVSSVIQDAGDYSFVIVSDSSNSVYFASREGEEAPQLDLVARSGPPPPPPPPVPPEAQFSTESQEGMAPMSVVFQDLSTGGVTEWHWDFGDGTASDEQNPEHLYTTPGTFEVSLTVQNDVGQDEEVKTAYVNVMDPGDRSILEPVADALVKSSRDDNNYGDEDHIRIRGDDDNEYRSYLKFYINEAYRVPEQAILRLKVLDGSSDGGDVYAVSSNSADSDQAWTEENLTWNSAPPPESGVYLGSFGPVDGGTWVELDVSAAVVGTGYQSFMIMSESSNSAYYSSKEGSDAPELEIIAELGPPPPPPPLDAGFSVDVQEGVAPLSTTFEDLSVGVVTTWYWDFGDGSFSTEQNPSHTYGEPGLYEVSLTVENSDEIDTEIKAAYITVVEPGEGPVEALLTDDAKVRLDRSDRNYGDEDQLRIRDSDSSYWSYLRFEVGGIAGPVRRATLRLYAEDGSPDGGAVYHVSNLYLDGSSEWEESEITAENGPALTGSPLDQLGEIEDNQWAEFDVTAAINGSGTYSFAIESGSSNSAYYSSKEGEHPPELIIEP